MKNSNNRLLFVTGGSGSGKSAFAERQVVESGLAQRIYLATMQPFGEESARRIKRHREMRMGKGFLTAERDTDLMGLDVPEGGAVLLEDLTNLFANEWFSVSTEGARERVLSGLAHVREKAALLVVVGNDIFRDGEQYPPETEEYLAALSDLNRAAAEEADEVWEVVCGIPLYLKKEATP